MSDPDFTSDTDPDFTTQHTSSLKGMPPATSHLPLATSHIAILGLGLMGGSLALALRGHCKTLLAADPDPATRQFARQFRVVDRVSAGPADILPHADLVILAAPVRANLQLLEGLPGLYPGPLAVLDISSTKREIVNVMARLPERFDPLGGHPMCGKETSGLPNADPNLFRGAPFAFSPLSRTSPRLRALAQEISRALGARALWLDAETHDRWVAATSHLPYLIAAALALGTLEEAAPLIGPGFRSTSRLASSGVNMMSDILITNRAPILQALSHFRVALDEVEAALRAADSTPLHTLLTQARARRHQLIH